MLAPVGQAPARAVVILTSATFAVVALIAIVPVTSGGGRLLTPFAPAPSATSKYPPAGTETFGKLVTCHVVPVAAAYWTDQAVNETATMPPLNSSMKSFL